MQNDKPAILAVDDDPEVLFYLKTALTEAGHEVVTAGGLAAAREELGRGRFALVLSDLRLPAASGLDVLAEARRADPLTVGVVLTGHGSVESAMQALREGAYDYLLKPCPPDLLLASVRRALEHYRLNETLIRQTKQLEALRDQLEDKSRILQNVSHELKNPLSVVYGYSTYLLRQPEHRGSEELRRSLQSIHNNAARLNHLLEEMLEASRLSGGKIELERKPLKAAAVCGEAVESYRFEAARRDVALVLGGPFPEGDVEADPRRLQQVLSNLLSNALKFTPAGGAITVSAAEDGNGVRFCVRDTGPGLSAEEAENIFKRFYQSETTRHSHQGLGLGLDISRGLVELHGGRIWVESEPGRGAAFYFTIPAKAAAAPPPR